MATRRRHGDAGRVGDRETGNDLVLALSDPTMGGTALARSSYGSVSIARDPLMYTDVKVSLLFHREEDGAKNLLTLSGGNFRTSGTIDLGGGNLLRNHSVIQMEAGSFKAAYIMAGTAHTGALSTLEYFEETMFPFGPGRIASVAVARWSRQDGPPLDALFSSRYEWDGDATLDEPQTRQFRSHARLDGLSFGSRYEGVVRRFTGTAQQPNPFVVRAP